MSRRIQGVALLSASLIQCDPGRRDPPATSRAALVVSTGPDRDLRSFMIHLQAHGLEHVTEVRRSRDSSSSLSCMSDRRMHRFVEEVLNGSLQREGKDFGYRCVDFWDDETVADVAEKVISANGDLHLLAAVPRSAEDVIPVTDSLAKALSLPLICNDTGTTTRRIDKFHMQQALQEHGISGAVQARASSVDEAIQARRDVGLDYPVVVKPVNSGASDGVVLCCNDTELSSAVSNNIGSLGAWSQIKNEVVIQEYLQGEEFVVNTVSLNGNHRVLDLWHTVKSVKEGSFLYDHQLLVAAPEKQADVVKFCFDVLDAVGLAGGAAHLEVVRTHTGMHLIEINPRAAGHSPRATRQVGEDQWSALALAIAQPEAFLQKAQSKPCYSILGSQQQLVMVVFLQSGGHAEVHRDDLLKIIGLGTFWRFDRIGMPMFADAVQEESADAFWISAPTRGLFTVPLTVLLRGTESELQADLQHLRALEDHMYRPFGTYDSAGYVGPLEGGNASAWKEVALEKAVVPKVGTRIQALLGRSFQGKDGKVDYYRELDCGTISRWTNDRVLMTWDRTGKTSSIGKLAWRKHFRRLSDGPEVPAVGSRLLALPGNSFQHEVGDVLEIIYEQGDVGVVTEWMEDNLLLISWDRTGRSCTFPQHAWAERFKLLS